MCQGDISRFAALNDSYRLRKKDIAGNKCVSHMVLSMIQSEPHE